MKICLTELIWNLHGQLGKCSLLCLDLHFPIRTEKGLTRQTICKTLKTFGESRDSVNSENILVT